MPTEMLTNMNGDLIIDREIIPTAEEVTEVWSLIDASKGKVVDDKVLEDLSDLLDTDQLPAVAHRTALL